MAGLSGNMIAWTYTRNNGTTTYRMRAKKALTDQVTGGAAVKVGGAAAASTVPLPPQGFRPRRVYVNNGGVKRAVVAYEANAPIVTAGETINIQYGADSTAFTSTGELLEERGRVGITDNA